MHSTAWEHGLGDDDREGQHVDHDRNDDDARHNGTRPLLGRVVGADGSTLTMKCGISTDGKTWTPKVRRTGEEDQPVTSGGQKCVPVWRHEEPVLGSQQIN
jgi:hypothetical protein